MCLLPESSSTTRFPRCMKHAMCAEDARPVSMLKCMLNCVVAYCTLTERNTCEEL